MAVGAFNSGGSITPSPEGKAGGYFDIAADTADDRQSHTLAALLSYRASHLDLYAIPETESNVKPSKDRQSRRALQRISSAKTAHRGLGDKQEQSGWTVNGVDATFSAPWAQFSSSCLLRGLGAVRCEKFSAGWLDCLDRKVRESFPLQFVHTRPVPHHHYAAALELGMFPRRWWRCATMGRRPPRAYLNPGFLSRRRIASIQLATGEVTNHTADKISPSPTHTPIPACGPLLDPSFDNDNADQNTKAFVRERPCFRHSSHQAPSAQNGPRSTLTQSS